MFVFQFHLCEEKSGKARRRIFSWILNLLSFTSTIPYFLRKAIYRPPQICLTALRFIHEQKDDNSWKCFQIIGDVASKDEWVRDVCHFRSVSKTDSMPRPPPSNSPPPDSTQITTFKSEAAKVLSAAPPWSDQKLVTDKINFHLSSYGRVWSSRSWGDYPRKRVIGCLLNITATLLIGLEGSPRVQNYSGKNKFVNFHRCALCCERAWASCAFNLCWENISWENLILGVPAFPFIQIQCLRANIVLGFQQYVWQQVLNIWRNLFWHSWMCLHFSSRRH